MLRKSKDANEAAHARTRDLSLNVKFLIIVEVIALFVVLATVFILGAPLAKAQRERGAEAFLAKADTLIKSLTVAAGEYLPANDAKALSALAKAASLNDEVISVIIGEQGGEGARAEVSIWAASGEDVLAMIDTEERVPDVSRLNLNILNIIEGNGLIERGSFPPFNAKKPDAKTASYLFFAPVASIEDESANLGCVIVELSASKMIETMRADRKSLFLRLAATLGIAVLIGAVGAFQLFDIVALPLRRMARHAEAIRATDDMSLLQNIEIAVPNKASASSNDEIRQIAVALNEMTQALADAADREKELTVGKEMQKMLIPLETDSLGRKLAHGGRKTKKADFFGYYEAANGVSGDYFDYLRLDANNYAIIKCDVAGSGISAALVMVEIAAIFKDFFSAWSADDDNEALSDLAAKINDLIEARNSKGLFVALMLSLFNSESGRLCLCSAGDTVAHIFDASTGKLEDYLLCESPAAGIFPSYVINGGIGFITEELTLKKGDVLFLYTDGISEAKRFFRDEGFKPAENESGEDGEILTEERVAKIIEAVFSKGAFTLKKQNNPEGEEKEYRFDFSTCEGTIEEAVTALVSVEKVFRMYKAPDFTDADTVQNYRLIDSFLQKHFAQYDEYCSHKRPHKELEEYLLYEELAEDPQYDDLAILAIIKK